ncbi:MAG TPA: PP2C family serine/threonine-protein phosphatase [Blastocatellia bacterium]|nr:PP2C family serine/threonine-protein phosphatase [Blastocatellia bacterium]
MSDVKVSVFGSTDVGMQRTGNEDAFLVADLTAGAEATGTEANIHAVGERGSLLVVSDGMGGAAAGEIASELAVTTIHESLMESPSDLDVPLRLRIATEVANERIWNHAQENPDLSGMGATVTAALVHGPVVYIAQVGDSRAYLIRGSQIKQLTKDQSLAQMLIDSGAILPEQAASVPQNVIMQALGTQPTVKVAMTTVQICRDDCLLLCSDGLSNKIQPSEMKQSVQQKDDLPAACRWLIDTANERGGEDNITVVIARFDGETLSLASEVKSITGSFGTLSQDYMSESASLRAAAMPDPGVTTMLTAPDKFETEPVVDSETSIPDVSAEITPLLHNQEFTPVLEEQPEKKSYAVVWIAALLSLILIAATLYFFYTQYTKTNTQPETGDQPTATEPPNQ